MPLIDEEWRAFINEYNGVMGDVEADLGTALEGVGLTLNRLADRGALHRPEAEALYETLREFLIRAQDRLNAFGHRILEMRQSGEL